MKKLSNQEIDALEIFLSKYVEKSMNSFKFHILDKIENSGQIFEDTMEAIATQKNWNRKNIYEEDTQGIGFAGGFSSHVFSNLCFFLGLEDLKHSRFDRKNLLLKVIIIKKLIDNNPQIKLFVEAVISATKVVDSVKAEIYKKENREGYTHQGTDLEELVYCELGKIEI